MVDAYSRFGIKGSNEVSDGLSAVYRFETKINTTNANLDGGRLSYVGLSGGFGTITIGQIWGASYNHAGAVFDLANYGGGHNTSGRVGNALSYSISTGSVSAQIDAIMDGGTDSSGGGIDQFEFGLSFDMGDIGKIALAHRNVRDVNTTKMVAVTPSATDADTQYSVAIKDGKLDETHGVWRDKTTRAIVKPKSLKITHKTGTGADAVEIIPVAVVHNAAVTTALPAATVITKKKDGKYYSADCAVASPPATCKVQAFAWIKTSYDPEASGGAAGNTPTATFTAPDVSSGITRTATATVADVTPGHKTTNLAVQFNLGAITAHLGTSQIKMNNMAKKTKVTHFGVNGGLGDTGMSFYAAGRNIKPADSMEMKSTPWVIGLNRSLGDGAKVWLEHENLDNGKSGTTTVGLNVDF